MINLSVIRDGISNRFLHFSLLFFMFHICYAVDNNSSIITPTQNITNSQTLTSTGHVFKLGFFSPPDSTNRYVGIWYEFDPTTIVWVANRDNPLKDSTGTLRIADDGNLVIADGRGVVCWTTNMSDNITTPNNLVAELLDTGNFFFDHPTHTLLPGMKIEGSIVTGKKLELTSWKSESDPSTGIFSAGPELSNANNPQLVIWRNGSEIRLLRSGPWNNIVFIGIAEMTYADAFYSSKQEDNMYISFRGDNKTKMHPRFVLDHHGAFIGKELDVNLNNLSEFWSSRSNICDSYGMCGPFGSCNPSNSPICSCLIGFRPKFEDEWSNGNWSGGCVRITQLECQTVDGFIKLGSMKVPDYAIASLLIVKEMEECNRICLMNCSCVAYSYDSGIGCMTWGANLVDIQQFTRGGEDLHIRLARSDIDLALKNSTDPARKDNTDYGLSQNVIVIVIIAVLVGILAISICTYFYWKWLSKQRDPMKRECLDWKKRFQIIEGISRGMLYLHRDSRLRVIHRDLKVSNILLDEDMDPKISDFGMARIFGGNEQQASTRRVVGTLGYMPPEYVLDGRFSEKSDVFSFGVLLLEVNCYAIDNSTITPTQIMSDSQTLTSTGRVFKLGFFSPPNSTHRYVGIWYEFDPSRNIVWVANRDNPLKDSTGTLRIADDGNLVIADGRGDVFWTTNVSDITTPNNSVAELLDTGNFEFRLLNDVVWQSFDHPTHTFLPGMKIGGSLITGKKQELTSWKSESDPSTGIFSLMLELLEDHPQLVIWRNESYSRLWRSGPWNNIIFVGIAEMTYAQAFSLSEDNMYISYKDLDKLNMQFVLDHHGAFQGKQWDVEITNWYEFWSSQSNICDSYGMCGPFGSCNPSNSSICRCLIGFKPKFEDEWSNGNWSGGCVRITQLECLPDDGFIKLGIMKVPDYAIASSSIAIDVEDCNMICSMNCSCIAYSYDSGIGCLTWGANLVDIQQFTQGGKDLYIRLARSDIDPARKDNTNDGLSKNIIAIVIIGVLVGTLAISICTYFFWKWLSKQRGYIASDMDNIHEETPDNPDQLKIFKFQELATATNNFTGANMLGQDPTKRECLDWKKRFQIIEGISRGMLYLHRDSRLRVIHRDLKVSNILLDEDLNPKISDFGMARIFGGDEQQASTRRVVGTLGYIPPEYLMDGRFSEKSDVFSFGVLLLEVVSGRKITSFHHLEESLSLLGYVRMAIMERK
ncbi:hypothetical protein MKX01_019740 [Papaver californicum]|nr:hypothetical protein MKX01_019740 [Papaver californicum]